MAKYWEGSDAKEHKSGSLRAIFTWRNCKSKININKCTNTRHSIEYGTPRFDFEGARLAKSVSKTCQQSRRHPNTRETILLRRENLYSCGIEEKDKRSIDQPRYQETMVHLRLVEE